MAQTRNSLSIGLVYAELVQQYFNRAVNVEHYRWLFDYFYFDLEVLERKGLLQDQLYGLMLEEPNLDRILRLVPS